MTRGTGECNIASPPCLASSLVEQLHGKGDAKHVGELELDPSEVARVYTLLKAPWARNVAVRL